MSANESPLPARPHPWKCGNCGRRSVRPAVVPYATVVEHDGRSYPVHIPALEVAHCDDCGEIVLDDAANLRITDAFRVEAGLLNPEQIRTNRERLGLTQRQLAARLGIAEATLSRWETGAQVQQRALDRLMRLFFGMEQVRLVLADDAGLLALGTAARP